MVEPLNNALFAIGNDAISWAEYFPIGIANNASFLAPFDIAYLIGPLLQKHAGESPCGQQLFLSAYAAWLEPDRQRFVFSSLSTKFS